MRIALFAAAAAAFAATSAFAMTPEREATSAFLSTAQVDFRDQASTSAFYARLERVARQVCDTRSLDRSIQREDAACMREVKDAAVARLSRPLLTAAHQARSRTAFARGY